MNLFLFIGATLGIAVAIALCTFALSDIPCPDGQVGMPVLGKGMYCVTAERWRSR